MVCAEHIELHPDCIQVQEGNLLVEVLRQGKHLVGVLALVGEQLNLSNRLVGKGIRHNKRGMARGATQINQTALGEHNNVVAVNIVEVNLRLNLRLGVAVVLI